MKELAIILDTTMEQAELRRSGAQKEIETTKSEMKNVGKGGTSSADDPLGIMGGTGAGEETKVLNGKTYVKRNGQWYSK